jgi:hypothetical protein
VVVVHFVDTGGIVDHVLSYLFIIIIELHLTRGPLNSESLT